MCKQSAPRSRQITTPAPHHSKFPGRMLFLTPSNSVRALQASYCDYMHYVWHFLYLLFNFLTISFFHVDVTLLTSFLVLNMLTTGAVSEVTIVFDDSCHQVTALV